MQYVDAQLADAVASDEIDSADFDLRNPGVTPQRLLSRLETQRPSQEDFIVVYGDATLENLMIDMEGNVGFIDCAAAGRGDR